MTLIPRKFVVCAGLIFLLCSVCAPIYSQTLNSDGTLILGVVEPLEMTGEPKSYEQPTDIEKRIAEINPKNFNDSQELRNAKEAVDQLIQQYPGSAEALSMRLLFSCEIKSKDVPVDISDIDAIIRLQKTADNKDQLIHEPELLATKAKIEFDSGNHKKAVEDLYAAISADVKNADNLLNSGGVEPENKSAPCSWYKPDLDQLVKENPTDYHVYLYRGLYYLVFQRFSKAKQYAEQTILDFQHAATLNPKSPLAPYFLGKSYVGTLGVAFGTDADAPEKRTKALAAYDRAILIDPHFMPAYAERAEMYYEAKQWREAIKNYDKIIDGDPTAGGVFNDRALAKSELHDSYSAISDFSDALRNKEKLAALSLNQTYENRADEYVKVQNYAPAIKDYTQAIKILIGEEIFLMNVPQVKRLYPEYKNISDDVLCRKLHAMFFPNMKYEDFAKQLTEVNRGDFDTFLIPDVLVKRGDAYLKAGDLRRAITDYQRAAAGFAYGKNLDRWHLVSKGNQELYLDSETAEFDDPNLPKFWVKLVDTSPTAKGAYDVEQYAVDCRLKKIDLFSLLKYDAKGTVLGSNDNETGWASTVPDSLGEQLYRGMCH
jgi:tetratricopeptide (TPR) repeat protein